MSNYRRAKFKGGYYFFTVVTFQRRHFLTDTIARQCFRYAWNRTRQTRPFKVIALCLLPDHLHCIWKLSDGDTDFSTRWSMIKGLFTRRYLQRGGQDGVRNKSRGRTKEAAIWQRRFWEHQLRAEADLQRHFDYIHYNPVKHGWVQKVDDWPWSTYHRYRRQGFYSGPDAFDGIDLQEDDILSGE